MDEDDGFDGGSLGWRKTGVREEVFDVPAVEGERIGEIHDAAAEEVF